MSAIFREIGNMLEIRPTAALDAGTVVALGGGLVGVTTSSVPANGVGYVNIGGEYDVDVTAGTEYAVGTYVSCAAKTLAGVSTTVSFGPATRAATSTATSVRCLLCPQKRGLTDSTGGTAGTSLVAPASTAYTAAELEANFATLAKYLNM